MNNKDKEVTFKEANEALEVACKVMSAAYKEYKEADVIVCKAAYRVAHKIVLKVSYKEVRELYDEAYEVYKEAYKAYDEAYEVYKSTCKGNKS